MRRIFAAGLALVLTLLNSFFAAAAVSPTSSRLPVELSNGLYAEFVTPRGTITCELFYQKAPLTVTSFVGLAEGKLGPVPRRLYFNDLTFHRVVPGFVIQGGDPLGNGEGGPGYDFPDEFVPGLRHDAVGTLSMANGGPDTNGSQFFITLAPVNRLNYLHTVFGRVVRGLEILPAIQQGDAIITVKILRVGAAAAAFRADESSLATLIATKPRATPLAFDDAAGQLQTDPPRAKTLNFKLLNFNRFTGVKLYARLFDKFFPSSPGQSAEEFAADLGKKLALGPQDALVVWFSEDNRWLLVAPGRPDLKLPSPAAWPALKASPAPKPEEIALDHKRQLLAALNDVVDGLIFQLETK